MSDPSERITVCIRATAEVLANPLYTDFNVLACDRCSEPIIVSHTSMGGHNLRCNICAGVTAHGDMSHIKVTPDVLADVRSRMNDEQFTEMLLWMARKGIEVQDV